MASLTNGILGRRITETPIAVLDFETTGLSPGNDRVVEVSVVRIELGSRPRLVFDSLVNPDRRVAATESHGLTDWDVGHAPDSRTWRVISSVPYRTASSLLTTSILT